MPSKIVTISIPNDCVVPEVISSFSLEENYLMLKIGCECLNEGRKAVVGLTQKEIYNKLQAETKSEIENLQRERWLDKEKNKVREESIAEIYDRQILKLNQRIETLTKELSDYEINSEEYIKKEIEKHKSAFEEKEKRVLKITENYENFLRQTAENKSSKKLGDEGEENFLLLSETFRDFAGYRLEKKAHQAHKGDFHLFFNEFSVLVDLKNYSGSVQKKELDKIEHDLIANHTIDFAWLISYDSNVSDWNRFPIMYKWVVTETGLKCIIIVNNLNANKNQVDVLRSVWNMTYEFNNMINKTKMDDEDIKKMRERDFDLIQKIKTTQKRLAEMKKHIMSMSQTTRDIENDILYALSSLSNEIMKNEWNKNSKINEWLEENIEFTGSNEDKILSTEMWNKFKKENIKTDDDDKISLDEFKNYLKIFVDSDNYVEKSKKGTIELIGYKLKEDVIPETPKLGIELNIPVIINQKEQKKKIIKKNGEKI